MSKTRTDFIGLLQTLNAHRVAFIIVGGASAALQGAPINTLDLDIKETIGRDKDRAVLAILKRTLQEKKK